MNENTNAAANLPAPAAVAKLPSLVSPHTEAMPLALALYLDDALYERVSSVASRMSKAIGVTPKHLVGQPEACFAVVSRAITWRLDPFAVAMATYQTPGGQIGFEGKLVHAILENSGKLEPTSGGIRYEHYGDWSKVQGRFAIIEKQKDDGKKTSYAAPRWTDDDARTGKPTDAERYPMAQSCGVRVIAHLRGEREPRTLDFDLIQAQPRNSTLWATDPMTQICYTAVRRFGSAVAPSLLMGVPFDPVDNAPSAYERDVTPAAADHVPMPRARAAAPAASAPHDVNPETGETGAPAEREQDAAVDALAGMAAAAKAAQPAAPADKPAPAEPIGEAMKRKASPPQRQSILNLAKRKGLSVAQLDEKLVDRFTFGIDELPMNQVGAATQLIAGLPDAQF